VSFAGNLLLLGRQLPNKRQNGMNESRAMALRGSSVRLQEERIITGNSPQGDQRTRLFHYCFFGGLFAYCAVLGAWGQSSVHPYFDFIGIRDAGTLLSYYASGPEPLKTVVGQAMLHFEGPLQFLLLNAYSYLVGDILPLDPLTMQLPNTLLVFATLIVAYFLGKHVVSDRFGYLCALAFALSPWLGETIRVPWYFNTLSCLLHFAVFLFFFLLLRDPRKTLPRVAAPACLALYLFTGMDWPSFLFSLGLFLLLSGRLIAVARNPYNLLPLAAVLAQLLWPLALWATGRGHLVKGTMVLYPFFRYGDLSANPDFAARVLKNVIAGWGPQLLLALGGIAIYVFRQRSALREDRIARSFFDAAVVWFAGSGYALVSSATSATYLYVAALPTAVLAAESMVRVRTRYLAVIAGLLAVFQVYVTSGGTWSLQANDDRRVLAAAAYLIEQRPDLLARDKTAFLPRNHAANVGQYARGQNKRVVMPKGFPVELRKHSIGSDEKTLRDFVASYEHDKQIQADWVILDSDLFSPDLEARDFYLRLRDDPNIRWLARFKDRTGGELLVGEVTRGDGTPFAEAPLMDTDKLAGMYKKKYDRIGFLKHNVQYVDHY
jgi:hypothetical protein